MSSAIRSAMESAVKTSLPPGYIIGYEDGRRHERQHQNVRWTTVFFMGVLFGGVALALALIIVRVVSGLLS